MSAFSPKSKVRIKDQRGYDGALGYITADLGVKTVRFSRYMVPEKVRYFRVRLIDRPNLPTLTFAAEELEAA